MGTEKASWKKNRPPSQMPLSCPTCRPFTAALRGDCNKRMPELPDIVVYIERLKARIDGQTLERVRVVSPFLFRSFDPLLDTVEGRQVIGLRRLGKRIAVALDPDLFLIFHLMIVGRF